MSYCIVVADGARARLFTAELSAVGNAVRLEEREVLTNPERNLAGREEFANLKPGRNRVPPRGAAHGYDDHRSRHRDQVERRFAARVADAAGRLVRESASSWFVLVAEPRLLGLLRTPLEAALPSELPRSELPANLSWHALPNIRRLLERQGVFPKSRPSPASWRPRVQPPPERPRRVEPPSLGRARHKTARPRRGRTKMRSA